MTLKPTPRIATWFLNRFGSGTQDETVMGDLFEQYQRGRGAFWYWRQVLSIVVGRLVREFRGDRRRFIVGLVKAWCVWGILQFTAGMILMVRYVFLHPEELPFGISVYGFPILSLRAETGSAYTTQWGFILLTFALNISTLLLVGRYCARSSKMNPRSLLLAFMASYLIPYFGWTMAILVDVARHQPNNAAFLALPALIALPFVPVLLLLGGMRPNPSPEGRGWPKGPGEG